MLDPENHDGLLVFLIGMIALVLLGVGSSLLLDRSSSSAKTSNNLISDIRQQEENIQHLEALLKQGQAQLDDTKKRNDRVQEKLRTIESITVTITERRHHANQLGVELKEMISELEANCHAERIRIRKWLAAHVAGESLGNFKTNDGRVYRDATIVTLNEDGLQIRHTGGSTYIPAANLPDAYQERFLWNTSRTSKQTEPLDKDRTRANPTQSKATKPSIPPSNELEAARKTLQNAGEKVEKIISKSRMISSMAENSSSISVPDSLNTWTDRMTQIDRQLADAKLNYAKARANLVIMSPNDPMLRVWRLP